MIIIYINMSANKIDHSLLNYNNNDNYNNLVSTKVRV